jgi:hypothetical protein
MLERPTRGACVFSLTHKYVAAVQKRSGIRKRPLFFTPSPHKSSARTMSIFAHLQASGASRARKFKKVAKHYQ